MKTVVSVSGGRSSGIMAYMLMDKQDHIFIFCNTGKELEETLEFVRDMEKFWGIPIVWLEFDTYKATWSTGREYNKWWFKQVCFETASRNGEPFEKLIELKGALPNPTQRWCTEELKIKTIDRYMKCIGHDKYRTEVGIRADELHRIQKIEARGKSAPLYDAGITKKDVEDFWQKQKFDLKIPSTMSNCDYCFMKGKPTLQEMKRSYPEKLKWWYDQEEKVGATFRKEGSVKIIIEDPQLDWINQSCFCGDN